VLKVPLNSNQSVNQSINQSVNQSVTAGESWH